MKIYTYYQSVDSIPSISELQLIELWKKSWSKHGWEPIVLNKSAAENHPFYRDYSNKIATYPTVNPRQYEDACYLRYLAVDYVGGKVMSDYDIMNYGFTPEHPSIDLNKFKLYSNTIPCLVSGNFKTAIKTIYDFTPTVSHCSDMSIFTHYVYTGLYETQHDLIALANEDTYLTRPLVHYNNDSMCKYNQPRHLQIQELRPI